VSGKLLSKRDKTLSGCHQKKWDKRTAQQVELLRKLTGSIAQRDISAKKGGVKRPKGEKSAQIRKKGVRVATSQKKSAPLTKPNHGIMEGSNMPLFPASGKEGNHG